MRKISRAGLIKKVDQAFSRFIRKSHSNDRGNVSCVTCGRVMAWQESQAGHFVKRGHAAVRWDPRNVYPQCSGCNLYLNGAQDQMSLHIVQTHGQETLEELLRLKHTTKRWTMPELRELLEKYREETL